MTAVKAEQLNLQALARMEEVHLCERKKVSASALLAALAEDIENRRPLILSILIKHLSYNREISVSHLNNILGLLKKGVSDVLAEEPSTAMTYVKAAELCVGEISLRGE